MYIVIDLITIQCAQLCQYLSRDQPGTVSEDACGEQEQRAHENMTRVGVENHKCQYFYQTSRNLFRQLAASVSVEQNNLKTD